MTAWALFPELEGHWFAVRDGDPRVAAMYARHYSYRPYKDNRRRMGKHMGFAGIGERIVLMTAAGDAAFVWRKFSGNPEMIEKYGWQTGIGCAFFRNEGPIRSSDLIREACEIAWRRWPGERLFTFVEDAKVKTADQKGRAAAGWCYRKAGWTGAGRNKDGRLTILECLPPTDPPTQPARRESAIGPARESRTMRRPAMPRPGNARHAPTGGVQPRARSAETLPDRAHPLSSSASASRGSAAEAVRVAYPGVDEDA